MKIGSSLGCTPTDADDPLHTAAESARQVALVEVVRALQRGREKQDRAGDSPRGLDNRKSLQKGFGAAEMHCLSGECQRTLMKSISLGLADVR